MVNGRHGGSVGAEGPFSNNWESFFFSFFFLRNPLEIVDEMSGGMFVLCHHCWSFSLCILGAGQAWWMLLFVILRISRKANINYTQRLTGYLP